MTTLLLLGLLSAAPETPAAATPAPAAAPAATPAAAANPAKELSQEAQRLFAQGRFVEAIEKFEAAQAIRPHPGLHFNLARCHEELGNWGKALRAYREYLRLMPKATDRADVEKSMVNLQKQLAAKGLQQLRVMAVPANATIEIDGQRQALSPLYVELPPGPHRVAVSANGFARYEKSVPLRADTMGDVAVELLPMQEEPPATPPLVDAPTLVPKADVSTENRPLSAEEQPPPPPKGRVFTWVALAASIGAAGSGLGFGIGAQVNSDQLLAAHHPRAEADKYVNRSQAFATTANISWGVAGGLLVTAAVLFFVEGAQLEGAQQ